MKNQSARTAAERISQILTAKGWTVSTAESCTGGLVAAALTAIPGASLILREAYVVYADEAKKRILGVTDKTLETAGSVSRECAGEMARNLEKLAHCDLALSVTGYAGPTGGTEAAPIGTVWFGVCLQGRLQTFRENYVGDRHSIRSKATATMLEKALEALEKKTA